MPVLVRIGQRASSGKTERVAFGLLMNDANRQNLAIPQRGVGADEVEARRSRLAARVLPENKAVSKSEP